jgi:uncharacterized RDD family membrane protein YckC
MQIIDSLLFNPFANALSERAEKMWPLTSRAQVMMSDFARGMGVLAPFLIILFILDLYYPTNKMGLYSFWPMVVIVMFNKDIVGGRSIAKRKSGFAIVKYRTAEPASQLQCFIRNVTCLIWPIEALLAFGGAEQRIGDFIAGTKVVEQSPLDNSTFTAELLKTRVSPMIILVNIAVIATGIIAQLAYDEKLTGDISYMP